MGAAVKVGIIGCGNIFPQYIRGCRLFEILDVIACADADLSRAQARAEEFGGGLRACSVDELLNDPEIEIVVNLTIPSAHAEISLAAIAVGKHVHSEKPLAVTREDGKRVIAAAKVKGVKVSCAPDTFLGGGLQTCRKLIDDGAIGVPVAATAFMAGHGPEDWHPNPSIFYQVGGGPMFDMGPYYLTALVHLLGPVRRVTGSARISFPERTSTKNPALAGKSVHVEVPTHLAGVLDFQSGAIGTLVTSFDVWHHQLPRIEIYGSNGTLSVPDPNTFGGPVLLRQADDNTWREIPLAYSADVGRGIGTADLAYAVRSGRGHRASGEMAYHVLDMMHAIGEASERGLHMMLESSCAQPIPLPLNLPTGKLDE
ncbi:MAG: Gfo/Idh/MocA family oxidoreductase [Anaerolineaceae bacterium]|nr:Gfo/Idh/MocA family oxidoreductase [Anaerolineaceae bacterium]